MGYSGKIFGSIPYEVREKDTPIYKESEVEKYLIKYFGSKQRVLDEVVRIFHDDKHQGNILNITTEFTKDEKWYGDDNYNICLVMENMFEKQNIIKKTCKELGLTYAQLAEQIGYSEPAIKKAIANENVSEPMQKSILLYLRTLELEKQLEDYTILKSAIKKAIN
jgi:hypothetical protein